MRTVTTSSAETEGVAAELAGRLRSGDVVLVSGELGSGKTTFVRGACRALGVTCHVTSPTFTIGQLYGGRVEVAHLDLYRLASFGPDEEAIVADYATEQRIAFVEWPAVAGGFDDVRIAARVTLEHLGGDRRAIEVE